MKLSIILIQFIVTGFILPGSIYEISLESVDGVTISMSDFKGKKILVAAISPDNLENGGLEFLDSIQTAYPSIVVIAVPGSDFGGTKDAEIMTTVKENRSKKILVAALSPSKKNSENNQNTLMRWLTHDSENIHFDGDVATDEQLYVISESGVLFSVLQKGTSAKTIENVLTQEDVKE